MIAVWVFAGILGWLGWSTGSLVAWFMAALLALIGAAHHLRSAWLYLAAIGAWAGLFIVFVIGDPWGWAVAAPSLAGVAGALAVSVSRVGRRPR